MDVHRPRLILAVVGLLLVLVSDRAGAAPASAPAPLADPWLIVPGQSLGLLRLGSPASAVSQIPGWGRPDRSHVVGTISYLTFDRQRVTIAVRDATAVMLLTTNERFRTERGLAVGKPASTVPAAYGPPGAGDERTLWYDALGLVVIVGGNTVARIGVFDPKTLVRVILTEERPARDVFLAARPPRRGPAPPKAEAGSQSLLVSVTVRNTGASVKVLNPNFFTLTDGNGRTYRYHPSTFGQKDGCRSSMIVRPGEGASCSLVFVLPAKESARALTYTDGASFDEISF
jgi:hypothetical protein